MATSLKISRVQKKGQVTIPAEIRHKLGLAEGDLVAFIETEDGVMISPQTIVPRLEGSQVLNQIEITPRTKKGSKN